MWKNVQPVSGAGIQTHDLLDMSLLPPYFLNHYMKYFIRENLLQLPALLMLI